jgi:hypothetical protein
MTTIKEPHIPDSVVLQDLKDTETEMTAYAQISAGFKALTTLPNISRSSKSLWLQASADYWKKAQQTKSLWDHLLDVKASRGLK